MKRRAFTLIEMLIVIAIAAILVSMIVGAFSQARYLARRTKADAQLRELITAWHEYFVLYGDWPADVVAPGWVDMTFDRMDALIDPTVADNPRGLVFLNVSLRESESYRDPWGNVYQLSFRLPEDDVEDETALRLSVHFPNRKRQMLR